MKKHLKAILVLVVTVAAILGFWNYLDAGNPEAKQAEQQAESDAHTEVRQQNQKSAESARLEEWSKKCGGRIHKVLVGDILFGFPAGKGVRNAASQYHCPRDHVVVAKETISLDDKICLSPEECFWHILYFTPTSRTKVSPSLSRRILDELKDAGIEINKLRQESGFYVYQGDGTLSQNIRTLKLYISSDPELIDAVGDPIVFRCKVSHCYLTLSLSKKVEAGKREVFTSPKLQPHQMKAFAEKFQAQAESYILEKGVGYAEQ